MFPGEETRSKALMGNMLGVLRSSRADVAGVERARGRGAGSGGGEKPGARPRGPVGQDEELDFLLCVTGRPGKVCSRERYNLTYVVKDYSGRWVENRSSEGKKGVQ